MRILASFVIVCALSLNATNAQTQLSRVDEYAVTPFESGWDSLSLLSATVALYEGGTNDGKYSIQLPFDFPFDGSVLQQGTMISVGANGAISLVNAAIPGQQLVGDPAHQMLIAPFNGDIKQGSDKKSGLADTIGLYQVTGVAPNRVLTIEYHAFHLRGGGSGTGNVDTLAAMQVKLYEMSGVIEFLYREPGLKMPSKLLIPPMISIGLNGSLVPEFRSKTIARDTMTIPPTNLRFTPGVASVDLADESELQLYPNPASNWMRLEQRDGESIVRITATDGAGIATELSSNEAGRVNISALHAGSYLLRIETNSQAYLKRMTVIR